MANKKKTESATLSPIQQLIAYATPKEDKCILSLPISETESIDIEVKRLLDTDEMASFVDGVANATFKNDVYMPAVHNLVLAKAIIGYYTNLKISVIDKNTKESVSLIPNEYLTRLVFCTNIVEDVKSKINIEQLDYMVDAIDNSIEFKKQEILNSQSARLEEVTKQIETLVEYVPMIIEQFDGIDIKQTIETVSKIATMSERDFVDNVLSVKFGEKTVNESVSQIEGQTSLYDTEDVPDESGR